LRGSPDGRRRRRGRDGAAIDGDALAANIERLIGAGAGAAA
jgi:hypothetical protein